MPAAYGRCAVLGSPIAHSLSPVMHRAAYGELGIGWTYEALDVTEDALAGFLDGVDDSWRGLSVTAPLKRRLVSLMDEISEDVEALGVANTVLLDERRGRVGFNTDVPGGLNALREAGVEAVASARILGGGATAASMALTLSRLGVRRLEVAVRDVARASDVLAVAEAQEVAASAVTLDGSDRGLVDVLVSTIPAGAVDPSWAASAGAVFDVIYDPWPTPLASAALEHNIPVVNGLDLLAHQAALQVHLMTGGTVAASLLRAAALRELAGRPDGRNR
ncbi:MAG: shikimate dehydrogenase [Aeromicrobium sp.]|uniref:shikimate dehydrogenase n=1 Tax=Aeromicrobium sp. TaxID=1871063 RepID=UPI0039E4DC34